MKRKTFLMILASCFIIIFTSCSKDDNETPINIAENVELLTSTDWVEQNLTFSEGGHDETAAYNLIYGDLSVSFNSNGTYIVNSQNYGILTQGTWTINESQTILTAVDTNSNEFNITIVSISSSILNLQFMYTYNDGVINIDVFIQGAFVPFAT